MMKRKTQQFIAAFVVTGIAIAALCGFITVDLSTERYMPADSGPLFLVSSIDPEGIRFSALGKSYVIASDQFDSARELVWQYRWLLPRGVTAAGSLTTRGYRAAQEYLEENRQPEEPF